MENEDSEYFPIRKDHHGLRVVYNLGNELGDCPFRCTFCNVGRSPKTSSEANIAEFDRLHARFQPFIKAPYHPLIYNQGNATSEVEFSRPTLNHVLSTFSHDPRVRFISLNSRERSTSPAILEELAQQNLPFPVHFILGIESVSPRAKTLLGKDTKGEMERFLAKLAPYNSKDQNCDQTKAYTFGIDANLVFLPEFYLDEGEGRAGNEEKIASGFLDELENLLSLIDGSVPVEINLHPYSRVETLPFPSCDLDFFMAVLPRLQQAVRKHNGDHTTRATHIFVGIEGEGYIEEAIRVQKEKWESRIDSFNYTGECDWPTDGFKFLKIHKT